MTDIHEAGPTGGGDCSPCLCLQQASGIIGKLSHPARLTVLFHLLSGEKSVRELQQVTETKPSNLEHHLKLLKESGLIASRRIGRRVVYALRTTESVKTVETLMGLA